MIVRGKTHLLKLGESCVADCRCKVRAKQRIDRIHPLVADLKMKMSRTDSRVAGIGDHCSFCHGKERLVELCFNSVVPVPVLLLTHVCLDLFVEASQMGIDGGEPVVMFDVKHLSVSVRRY